MGSEIDDEDVWLQCVFCEVICNGIQQINKHQRIKHPFKHTRRVHKVITLKPLSVVLERVRPTMSTNEEEEDDSYEEFEEYEILSEITHEEEPAPAEEEEVLEYEPPASIFEPQAEDEPPSPSPPPPLTNSSVLDMDIENMTIGMLLDDTKFSSRKFRRQNLKRSRPMPKLPTQIVQPMFPAHEDEDDEIQELLPDRDPLELPTQKQTPTTDIGTSLQQPNINSNTEGLIQDSNGVYYKLVPIQYAAVPIIVAATKKTTSPSSSVPSPKQNPTPSKKSKSTRKPKSRSKAKPKQRPILPKPVLIPSPEATAITPAPVINHQASLQAKEEEELTVIYENVPFDPSPAPTTPAPTPSPSSSCELCQFTPCTCKSNSNDQDQDQLISSNTKMASTLYPMCKRFGAIVSASSVIQKVKDQQQLKEKTTRKKKGIGKEAATTVVRPTPTEAILPVSATVQQCSTSACEEGGSILGPAFSCDRETESLVCNLSLGDLLDKPMDDSADFVFDDRKIVFNL